MYVCRERERDKPTDTDTETVTYRQIDRLIIQRDRQCTYSAVRCQLRVVGSLLFRVQRSKSAARRRRRKRRKRRSERNTRSTRSTNTRGARRTKMRTTATLTAKRRTMLVSFTTRSICVVRGDEGSSEEGRGRQKREGGRKRERRSREADSRRDVWMKEGGMYPYKFGGFWILRGFPLILGIVICIFGHL